MVEFKRQFSACDFGHTVWPEMGNYAQKGGKKMNVKAFVRKYGVKALALGIMGAACVASAEGSGGLGLTTFDPTTIGQDITGVITTYVLPAIGAVLGALFGIKALRFVWKWVSGLMNGRG